jgi:acetylglutamate kinase
MCTKKTIVIKYGGNAMISGELKAAVVEDLVELQANGFSVVLVHGGGPEIEALLKKTAHQSRFVNGLRYTDSDTLDVVVQALCGKVNKTLCALLQNAGAKTIGISGIDGGVLLAVKTVSASGEDLGFVGEIQKVSPAFLEQLLSLGLLPVLAPVCLNVNERESLYLNVNADTAAAQVAAALKCESFILMTDIAGILRDVNDASSLIQKTNLAELEALKSSGILSKGMLPKAECCKTALDGGVKCVRIIDGRQPHILKSVLLEGAETGTLVE